MKILYIAIIYLLFCALYHFMIDLFIKILGVKRSTKLLKKMQKPMWFIDLFVFIGVILINAVITMFIYGGKAIAQKASIFYIRTYSLWFPKRYMRKLKALEEEYLKAAKQYTDKIEKDENS